MTVLHSVDFFPSGNASVAIEPRLPQADFPEHHHDFHEIVIVEHGTGIHVFNGQPYTITGGTVCFVRDHDRHLYEHTDNLCLTNVLYRSPDRFQFLAGLNQLLPQEQDGQYPSHWRVNHSEASVTDIAYRCGFSDSNHFSTLFRREFNWSPRDIRQGRDGFLQ